MVSVERVIEFLDSHTRNFFTICLSITQTKMEDPGIVICENGFFVICFDSYYEYIFTSSVNDVLSSCV
jgi:hypothetical protein